MDYSDLKTLANVSVFEGCRQQRMQRLHLHRPFQHRVLFGLPKNWYKLNAHASSGVVAYTILLLSKVVHPVVERCRENVRRSQTFPCLIVAGLECAGMDPSLVIPEYCQKAFYDQPSRSAYSVRRNV